MILILLGCTRTRHCWKVSTLLWRVGYLEVKFPRHRLPPPPGWSMCRKKGPAVHDEYRVHGNSFIWSLDTCGLIGPGPSFPIHTVQGRQRSRELLNKNVIWMSLGATDETDEFPFERSILFITSVQRWSINFLTFRILGCCHFTRSIRPCLRFVKEETKHSRRSGSFWSWDLP